MGVCLSLTLAIKYTYYILVSSTYLLNMRLLFPYIAHNSVAFICVKAIYIYGHEFLVVTTKKEVTWIESPYFKITVLFVRQIDGSVRRAIRVGPGSLKLVLLLGSVRWVSQVSRISNYILFKSLLWFFALMLLKYMWSFRCQFILLPMKKT